jgi:hypothetical protein
MPEIVGHGAGPRTQRFSHGLRAPDRAPFHGTTPTAGHGYARKPSGVESTTWAEPICSRQRMAATYASDSLVALSLGAEAFPNLLVE